MTRMVTRPPLRRRRFIQLTAAGLAVSSLCPSLVSAQRGGVVWVSPRGTLEVLDDYPYWVAKRFGYFGEIETELLPAIMEATSSSKAVAEGKADMSYVSPGVFSLGIEQGVDLVSVWQMGALDVFDIALPLGSPIKSLKELEGKTIVLGDAGWSGIVDPMIAQAGGDPA